MHMDMSNIISYMKNLCKKETETVTEDSWLWWSGLGDCSVRTCGSDQTLQDNL